MSCTVESFSDLDWLCITRYMAPPTTACVMHRRANKIVYRGHTDPIFKREKILKVADLNKVYVSLFMFDQQNEGLPSSFKQFINKRNVTDVSMTTHGNPLYSLWIDLGRHFPLCYQFTTLLNYGIILMKLLEN